MRLKCLILLSGLIPGFSSGFSQDNLTARQIMDRSREVSKVQGLEAVSTLKIMDAKGRERIRKTSMASKVYDKGATEKRIIRFLSPADVKGTGMLIYDYEDRSDDMWIYMPALRKTRRIVSSEKSKSFMGSEFSNADISAPSTDDFDYQLVGTETIGNLECWKIEVIPKNDDIAQENGYAGKMTWIGKKDLVQRKSEYFDNDGELIKVLRANDVKILDARTKKYMATRMEMENVQNGRKSIFTIDRFEFNPNVKDEYFTVNYLEKIL